jgi:hypothetical protein
MRARFTAAVWAWTLTVAACAVAQSAPPAAPLQPFFAISSITTLDDHGAVTSTTCCGLMEVDSAGRRLTAHIDSASFDAPVRRATISDPIALEMITIDYGSRIATITLLPPTAASRMISSDKPFTSENPDRSDLGEKTIEGVKVHGYLWTTKDTDTGAVGVAGGTPAATADKVSRFNPSANPVINEWWWSPELRLFPLITEVDANGNKWIQKYEKIELKAPGPGTFSIPAGFHVTTVNAQPNTP